ncbi:hypothetical protein [Cyanobium gracile]|uniref:hypothetical protein n=1 Tax=Cyanobium gracile TaxID=59930 RepID=UPI001FE1C2BC|nr:hypothetical protein [Cyanobium gracile]
MIGLTPPLLGAEQQRWVELEGECQQVRGLAEKEDQAEEEADRVGGVDGGGSPQEVADGEQHQHQRGHQVGGRTSRQEIHPQAETHGKAQGQDRIDPGILHLPGFRQRPPMERVEQPDGHNGELQIGQQKGRDEAAGGDQQYHPYPGRDPRIACRIRKGMQDFHDSKLTLAEKPT